MSAAAPATADGVSEWKYRSGRYGLPASAASAASPVRSAAPRARRRKGLEGFTGPAEFAGSGSRGSRDAGQRLRRENSYRRVLPSCPTSAFHPCGHWSKGFSWFTCAVDSRRRSL